MRKEILLSALLITTSFLIGYLVGTNGSDRYFFQKFNKQVAVFDKKSGKIYVRDLTGDEPEYFYIDVINAKKVEYMEKK